MTAEELICAALALKGEPPDMKDDYMGYSLSVLNIILAETLPLENQIRFVKGAPELPAAPEITTFADPIEYDPQLLKTCLTYGLAAKLAIDDGDAARFNYFNNMYAQAFISGTPGKTEPIADSAWGGVI